jgi:hypothetical protein
MSLCDPAGSVAIYNDGDFIQFVWNSGPMSGRTDYLLKANITIQQTNTTEWWIKENEHIIYLTYAEVDTSAPAGPTSLPQLITLLVSWINGSNPASNPATTSGTDSFGRTKVSTTVNLFNAQFTYDAQPLLFTNLTVGAGAVSYTANYSSVTIATSTGATDSAIFQSKEYMPYRPDCDLFVTIGAILRTTATQPHNTARIGYYDDVNSKNVSADIGGSGVFFQYNGDGTIDAVLRQYYTGTQVDTAIAQSSWNIDKLDGTGASGITINLTDTQIYCFDLEMNAGRIRLGFDISGQVYWCHQFLTANVLNNPTLFSYSLPIRAEMFNSATAVADSIQVFSCSVDLDGSINTVPVNPFNYVMYSNITCPVPLISSGQHRPLLSISLQETLCRASIWPKSIEIDNETGVICLWRLMLNPTGLTPTWANVGGNSFAQYSTNDDTVTIGDNTTVLASGFVSNYITQDVSTLFDSFGVHADITGGIPDILTLSIEFVRGACKARGLISWQETK